MTTTMTKTTTTLLCEMKKEGTPTTRLERRGPLDATRFRRQKCATHTFFCFFVFFRGLISSRPFCFGSYYYPRILLGEDKGLQKFIFKEDSYDQNQKRCECRFFFPFFLLLGSFQGRRRRPRKEKKMKHKKP